MTDRLIPFRRVSRRDETPDDALVSACARGDNTALEELFHRHGDRVHRVLSRIGSVDKRDLDDVVQATFISIPSAARRFDRRASVGTWIVGIAVHVAQRHARGETRRRLAMAAAADHAGGRGAHPEGAPPDEMAAHRQAMARLAAGLDTLPVALRIVFALCDLEGVRGVEVARTLGVPEGTIWRRLHEARIRLRRIVEQEPAR
jgi:RNA polymerase sigma-70 factor (ECF subfamily)